MTDVDERHEAFRAIETIPSIRRKADFCFKWLNSMQDIPSLDTDEQKRQFLLNLICFATCVEGLFFYAAFAYVYFMRSKGLLNGLASGTNWVFRDESGHMNFALSVVKTVREEYPDRMMMTFSVIPSPKVQWPTLLLSTCACFRLATCPRHQSQSPGPPTRSPFARRCGSA